MEKVYLFWNDHTILITSDVNNQDEGGSIQFENTYEMVQYIRKNPDEFKNIKIYEQVSNGKGITRWEETYFNCI